MKFEAIKTLEGEIQIRTVIPGMEGFPVATVHPERVQTACGETRERDDMETARLLAAAPELLDALKGCADVLRESAKMHRLERNSGHGKLADLHADIARAIIASVERGGE